jgi:hypothetical protein
MSDLTTLPCRTCRIAALTGVSAMNAMLRSAQQA